MEYILVLLGLLVVWGGAYWRAPKTGKKWTFWGGFACVLTVVYFQFVLHPYRVERMIFDIRQLF